MPMSTNDFNYNKNVALVRISTIIKPVFDLNNTYTCTYIQIDKLQCTV